VCTISSVHFPRAALPEGRGHRDLVVDDPVEDRARLIRIRVRVRARVSDTVEERARLVRVRVRVRGRVGVRVRVRVRVRVKGRVGLHREHEHVPDGVVVLEPLARPRQQPHLLRVRVG